MLHAFGLFASMANSKVWVRGMGRTCPLYCQNGN